jgi:hypothetical protein
MYVIPFSGCSVSVIHKWPSEIRRDTHGSGFLGWGGFFDPLSDVLAGGLVGASGGGSSNGGVPSIPRSKTRHTFCKLACDQKR